MASSINASTTAGVVTTADTSGVLNIQTAGTTAIAISASQAVTMAGTLAVTGALSATGTGTLQDLITTTGALIRGTSIFRVESTAASLPAGTPTGLGLEMYASSGTQKISVYNRTTNLAGPLEFLGSTFSFNALVDLSNASAGQIKFPATQNASSNANTLDDYEEGTWTPSVSSMTTTGTPAYAGMYTKIGRVVTVTFYTTTANSGVATYATIAGTTSVAGLPFSANGVIPNAAGGFTGAAINGATSAGSFIQGPNAATTFYFISALSATQGISASITYYAST